MKGSAVRILSVDLGTSNTVAVLSAHGMPPRVVEVDGSANMPSAVFATEEGTIMVGGGGRGGAPPPKHTASRRQLDEAKRSEVPHCGGPWGSIRRSAAAAGPRGEVPGGVRVLPSGAPKRWVAR